MKVICIDKEYKRIDTLILPLITEGKIYDAIEQGMSYYWIIDDAGERIGVSKSRFLSLFMDKIKQTSST